MSEVWVYVDGILFPGATVIAQNDGWRYGDIASSEGERVIYIAKGAGAYHHVMFADGATGTVPDKWLLPDPVPSSATAGGSR